MLLSLLKKKIKERIYSKRSTVVKRISDKFNFNQKLKYHICSFGNKYPKKKILCNSEIYWRRYVFKFKLCYTPYFFGIRNGLHSYNRHEKLSY